MRKRRLSDEKIREMLDRVAFDQPREVWFPQFEVQFRALLKFEYYLDELPDVTLHPKYRSVAVGAVYRLLNQVEVPGFRFNKSIEIPDPLIQELIGFMVKSEISRIKRLQDLNPLDSSKVQYFLTGLKARREI